MNMNMTMNMTINIIKEIAVNIKNIIYLYMYKYIHTHIQTRACTQPACSEIWRPGRPQPLPGFELPFGKNGQENPVGATDGTSENFPGITLVFLVNYIILYYIKCIFNR